MGNAAKRTARDLERAEHRARVLELRLEGRTWKEVAEIVGCHPSSARELAGYAIKDVYSQKATEMVEITFDRLEALLAAAIEGSKHKKQPAWHDQALKVIAAQRKMLGIDKPTQSVVETKVTVSPEDLEKKLAGISQRTGDEPV